MKRVAPRRRRAGLRQHLLRDRRQQRPAQARAHASRMRPRASSSRSRAAHGGSQQSLETNTFVSTIDLSQTTPVVDYAANTIELPDNGLSTGQVVQYDPGDGDPIGGLTAGPYSVIVTDPDHIQLALTSSPNTPIDLVPLASRHRLSAVHPGRPGLRFRSSAATDRQPGEQLDLAGRQRIQNGRSSHVSDRRRYANRRARQMARTTS